jgi:hypothetical protein
MLDPKRAMPAARPFSASAAVQRVPHLADLVGQFGRRGAADAVQRPGRAVRAAQRLLKLPARADAIPLVQQLAHRDQPSPSR